MRYLFVATLLLLAACRSGISADEQQRIDQQTDIAFKQCSEAGLRPGSDDHYGCVRRSVFGDQQEVRKQRRTVTECKPADFGTVRCTTR